MRLSGLAKWNIHVQESVLCITHFPERRRKPEAEEEPSHQEEEEDEIEPTNYLYMYQFYNFYLSYIL